MAKSRATCIFFFVLAAMNIVGCVEQTGDGSSVQALADEFMQIHFVFDPVLRTWSGDRSADSELPSPTVESAQAYYEGLKRVVAELGELDAGVLSDDDRVLARALTEIGKRKLATRAERREIWHVGLWDGPMGINYLPSSHPIVEEGDVETLARRYEEADRYVQEMIGALRQGMELGYVAARPVVERVVGHIERIAQTPPEETDMVRLVVYPADWPDGQRAEAEARLAAAVEAGAIPALVTFADFLQAELLPVARADAGLHALPDGGQLYQARILAESGDTREARAIHALGLEEVAELLEEMESLIAKAGGEGVSTPAFLQELMGREDQRFDDGTALATYCEEMIDQASSSLPAAVGVPRTDARLRFLHTQTAVSYMPGSLDGATEGEIWFPSGAEGMLPRFVLPAITFHEYFHHVQFSYWIPRQSVHPAVLLTPANEVTEGMAFYAEGLADELGLYSGPEERIGMAMAAGGRAARLIVDTGIHGLGWSREQAIRMLVLFIGGSEEAVSMEVDRYIAYPGQALGYALGREAILSLRQLAEEALGDAFALEEFHRAIMDAGPVPRAVLEDVVRAFIEGKLEGDPES